ncbi:globin domain-containing protein [uncultured Enterovirga sp.]|uniref:globin domain-containing protein n=1 Tax=uncultured Enterovirga sp. TaxID=2026352 RepID=UPI0035CC4B00
MPALFIIRPRSDEQSGFRLLAGDSAEAVRLARQMEERGLVVEILDPNGTAHPPDDLDLAAAALGPTPAQVGLIQSTCDVLLSANLRAADIFYDRLFALAPETRSMFEDDLTGQKQKLLDTLGSLVGYLTHPDLLGGAISNLGRRHARYGVEPAHYGPAGEALLASLAELLGPRFTPEVRKAWTALYAHLSREMLKAQRQGAGLSNA